MKLVKALYLPFVCLSLLVTVDVSAFTQNSGDSHIADESARSLYVRSPFAHGYRHGYEEGFHLADSDIHMLRAARQVEKLPEFKHAGSAYKSRYGDRKSFLKGYRQGMRTGYEDGINLREFRALDLARAVAKGLPTQGNGNERSNFDAGFVAGYDAGYLPEEDSPQSQLHSLNVGCAQTGVGGAMGSTYCQGFLRGLQFGSADARVAGIDAAQNRGLH